jgi:excinuclease ABC subunit C
MKSQDLAKISLPGEPGVYKFISRSGEVLYIGKATSLRSRVQSYFGKDLINTRGPLLVDMVFNAHTIEYAQTDSVLEALILEAELIKKFQPKYNTKEKDNKSFNYVCITKEVLPKVLVIRGRALEKKLYKNVFGPFTNGQQLREALKIIRRIFPFYDDQSVKKQNYQFYKQLALIPSDDYKNNLKNLVLFFQGKKKRILQNLKKEMLVLAKQYEFERAGIIKKQIFALQHINDIALIKEDITDTAQVAPFRIEAYDIAHISGSSMVGVMVVVENGQVQKSEYKKFNIKTVSGANDPKALGEILERRFKHLDWSMPDLIVVDGNDVQINVTKKVLKKVNKEVKQNIPIVSVVKDDKHKARAVLGDSIIKPDLKKLILLANNEAHRFATTFHRTKRAKAFLPKTVNKYKK